METGRAPAIQVSGEGLRIALVVARFYPELADRLTGGAQRALAEAGVSEGDVTVLSVPGCFELPVVAAELVRGGRCDAVVCLGVVIKGETAHFDFVAQQAAAGIGEVGRQSGVPVMFGVLTTYTMEQALERSGGKEGNKGAEVARGAVEMARLMRHLAASRP